MALSALCPIHTLPLCWEPAADDKPRFFAGSLRGGWLYLMGLDPFLMEILVLCAKVDKVVLARHGAVSTCEVCSEARVSAEGGVPQLRPGQTCWGATERPGRVHVKAALCRRAGPCLVRETVPCPSMGSPLWHSCPSIAQSSLDSRGHLSECLGSLLWAGPGLGSRTR